MSRTVWRVFGGVGARIAGRANPAISNAREAVAWFQQGTNEQQQAFLTLLLFHDDLR
jgi:hypothetical protein